MNLIKTVTTAGVQADIWCDAGYVVAQCGQACGGTQDIAFYNVINV